MFKNRTIENRVMSVIRARIRDGQDKFDRGCEEMDEKHLALVASLESKLEIEKNELADSIVNSLLK